MAERFDSLEGFLLFNGLGGATGSGLSSRLMEELEEDYPKAKSKDFNIHPFHKDLNERDVSTNSVFCLGALKEITDFSFILENDRLFDVC
jgi:tubulin alpha